MRILIVDDHELFGEGLHGLLVAGGHEVIGEARDGREAVSLARQRKPDLVLMDLEMPEMGGVAATRLISAELPSLPILLVTASDDDPSLLDAVESGAQGYLLKNFEAQQLFEQIAAISRGEPGLAPAIARHLLHAASDSGAVHGCLDLGEPDRELLRVVATGVATKRGIAIRLGISKANAQVRLTGILRRLHAHNRPRVLAFAARTWMAEGRGKQIS
jgi:DNA-binding NarL/FixJ family response regulator